MAKQTPARAKEQTTLFFPTQAYLGYPKDYEKEPALKKRRRDYAEFSRKLRAILAPLLINRYALHEDMLVLTSKGFSGQGVDAPRRRHSLRCLCDHAHPGGWHHFLFAEG